VSNRGPLLGCIALTAITGTSAAGHSSVQRASPGSLAMLAAILRASSFVSNFAADRRPLDEDGGVLLDRCSLLATNQALRAIAIFAVGRSDHHSVSGVLEIGPVVLGERRHFFLLIERNLALDWVLPDSNSVCDQRHRLVVPRQTTGVESGE
jgi:hypothetical protein